MSDAEEPGVGAAGGEGAEVKVEEEKEEAMARRDPVELTARQVAAAKDAFVKHVPEDGEAIPLSALIEVLKELGLRLDEKRYARYVESQFDAAEDKESLAFEEFLGIYSRVAAPTNTFGRALRTAAGRGENDAVKDLVIRGCNPNAADGLGWTAVHHAAEYGHVATLELLDELLGLDLVVDCDDKQGWTPLFNASANGHTDVVRFLLESGAEVNERCKLGRTALHCAAGSGQVEVVTILLKSGGNPRFRDDAGWIPLNCACVHGHEQVVRALVEAGFDPDQVDVCGNTVERYCTDDTLAVLRQAMDVKKSRPSSPRSPRA